MIRRLKVGGFKSLRSTSVDLGAVNVFIGPNGGGKSNVLEALGALGAAVFGTVQPETLKYRGVRPGLPVLYKSSFSKSRKPRLIRLEVENDAARYRVGLDNPVSGSLSAWGVHSETLEDEGDTLLSRSPRGCNAYVGPKGGRQERRLRLSPPRSETAARSVLQQVAGVGKARALVDVLQAYAIYSPTTHVLRGLASDTAIEPLGLSGGNLVAAVGRLLADSRGRSLGPFDLDDLWSLLDWADKVAVVRPELAQVSPAVNVGRSVLRFRDRFMAEGRNTLSAYDASEGALYVLFLLTLAAHPGAPRLFAVDHFDHALHPRLAAELMRIVVAGLLEQTDRQMLLTTHNPLVLDGLDLRNDEVRLFAVERALGREIDEEGNRRAEGETMVRRVELSGELLQKVDSGLSLSRLWVMGRLGAVPPSM